MKKENAIKVPPRGDVIKKVAEFAISENLPGSPNTDGIAVKLLIDYRNKSYSIFPNTPNRDSFLFKQVPKPELWKAVCRAIIKAVDFAEQELAQHKISEP